MHDFWQQLRADDPLAIPQLGMRTNQLRSSMHDLGDRVGRLEWQQRFLLAGSASAIVGAVVTVARFAVEVGLLHP